MKIEIRVPSIGESISEVTLSAWLVSDGDVVKIDQSLCEFESDKATLELPAEAAGVVTRVASEGADLKIGDLVCYIETDAAATTATPTEEKAEAPAPTVAPAKVEEAPTTSYAASHPSPSAKKILDEKGVSPESVQGTGVGGRITKDDAVKATPVPVVEEKKVAPTPTSTVATPSAAFTRGERVEKLSRMRKTIAKRLVEVKNNTAMLTTFNEVDMTNIIKIRDQYKDAFFEKNGVGLGFMSFFTKACCLALQKFPALNAYITDENVIYHDFCDISIAVSTPKGLVVPVVRNAESLSFAGIEKEIKRLAVLGRDGALSMEDMEGGTFTITNGGVFGSLMSTPIINQPQSAILGMHKVQDRPMVINGQIVARPMMYLALSYDHRIVDGKESVGFLVTVKDYLENPEKIMLGL